MILSPRSLSYATKCVESLFAKAAEHLESLLYDGLCRGQGRADRCYRTIAKSQRASAGTSLMTPRPKSAPMNNGPVCQICGPFVAVILVGAR